MKFSTIATALFGANVALAARFTDKRRERNAARAAAARTGLSLPRLPVGSEADVSKGLEFANDTAHVEYSSNWAGAVLIGTGYKSVTGTFVVPTPSTPSGGSSGTEYAASAWVGIDGDTASNSVWHPHPRRVICHSHALIILTPNPTDSADWSRLLR